VSVIDLQRRFLTIDQVAERLSVSRRTVERKIRAGEIPSLQLGGPRSAIRVDALELDAWLSDRVADESAHLVPRGDADSKAQ
jgi:excisionase family DNA binding protein